MYNFRQLRIWHDAKTFAIKIYVETKSLPNDERLGLTSQMRRAAISIPSNIAEACGREGKKSVSQFLNYAISSAFELETQLILSSELNFIDSKSAEQLIKEIQGIQKGIYFFKKNLR